MVQKGRTSPANKLGHRSSIVGSTTPTKVGILLITIISVFVCSIHILAAPELLADSPTTIRGQIRNTSPNGALPDKLDVVLHMFHPEDGLETRTTTAKSDGKFSFHNINNSLADFYRISTTHRGISYSQEIDVPLSTDLVELTIFDTTSDINVLNTDSHVWIAHNVEKSIREITVLELVLLSNDHQITFDPDTDNTSAMNFLRFSLPPGANTLEVQSDLPGGDVMNVGTGFGLSSVIPPGSHQIAFTYKFPYSDHTTTFSQSFLQGADTFRLLIPNGIATINNSQLEKSESALIGETSYQVWETGRVHPRSSLDIALENLPTPSLWERIPDGGYLFIGAPSLLTIVLFLLIGYGLRFASPKATPRPSINTHLNPHHPTTILYYQIANLDDLFDRQLISLQEYQITRATLKNRIISILKGHNEATEFEC